MRIDFDQIDKKLRYKLLTAAIIPRPPALVTTVDLRGTPNAAPYSFFNCFSDDPPIVALGIGRRPSGPKKDTGRNIEETGAFVGRCTEMCRAHLGLPFMQVWAAEGDVRLRSDEVQERGHGLLGIEHGLVHVDVNHL